jgi:gamma-glutamylcyclotransferase (GGCT)/AIG2-like uncharacterized protein YtfP
VGPVSYYPLFVYGTLLRGQPNHYLLDGRIECVLQGWMEGVELYSLGAFPVMVDGHARVIGEIISVCSEPGIYTSTLALLDRLEGVDEKHGLYRRVLRPVFEASGREMLTWVYIGRRQWVRGRPKIEEGDWTAFHGVN